MEREFNSEENVLFLRGGGNLQQYRRDRYGESQNNADKSRTERSTLIDAAKGIGIISIVIGHAFNTDYFFSYKINLIRCILYYYHLAIFFFCSGYCFRRGKDMHSVLKNVFTQQYVRSTLFAVASFVLLPLWMITGAVENVSLSSITIRLMEILRYFPSSGIFTGAMWFMPFFTIATLLFYVLDTTIGKSSELAYVIVEVCLGISGVIMIKNGMLNTYFFSRALAVQPILLAGKKCRQWDMLKTTVTWERWQHFLIFVCTVGLLFMAALSGIEIELSKNIVPSSLSFFSITAIGMVLVISLANLIKGSWMEAVFVRFGKNSFFVMGVHGVVFKLWDVIAKYILNISPLIMSRSIVTNGSLLMRGGYVIWTLLVLEVCFLIREKRRLR